MLQPSKPRIMEWPIPGTRKVMKADVDCSLTGTGRDIC